MPDAPQKALSGFAQVATIARDLRALCKVCSAVLTLGTNDANSHRAN